MGTRISDLEVIRVVDGDTIDVKINSEIERLRLICVDTEESHPGGTKPVTLLGKKASQMAKEYFGFSDDSDSVHDVKVDIEFDTDDPLEICLKKHRGNHGRLLCYVHKGAENYNLKIIEEGWSPYFEKYGRSRMYHEQFNNGEFMAQSSDSNIWNTLEIQEGHTRGNYYELKNWWSTRALVVEDYRKSGLPLGVLSVRLDYEKIVEASENEEEKMVLCDLQGGIDRRTGNGAVVFAGSRFHKFNLWIPNIDANEAEKIINVIDKRYAGHGRGYVYVRGVVNKYNNIPQIILSNISQISDFPS